jgi:succinate dehydrogenase flavin-adding protein (antitoxin of CptAB toxin-antitoxin module)
MSVPCPCTYTTPVIFFLTRPAWSLYYNTNHCADQSRKRGTLESDLLLSTFADAHLATMPPPLLQQYDLFLDENDWDIYYWATQEPSQTSRETAEGSGSDLATPNAQGTEAKVQEKDVRARQPGTGEWAQTVGTFKPAYRPVPQRWKGSEILSLLRRHVKERSAGGVMEDLDDGGKANDTRGKGLGMMPDIKNFDQ